MYDQRLIPTFPLVENAVLALLSPDGRTRKSGLKKYNTLIKQYGSQFMLDGYLYTSLTEEEQEGHRKRDRKYFRNLRQIWNGQALVKFGQIPSQTYNEIKRIFGSFKQFLQTFHNKLLTIDTVSLGRLPTDEETRNLNFMLDIILTDPHIRECYDRWASNYITGIYNKSSSEYKYEKRKLNFSDVPAREASLISICNKYIHTELDPDGETIHDMIKNGNHVDYQCWINLLLDLLKESKVARYGTLTRDSLIKELGRSELTGGNGFTITELEPFFQRHRIQVRIFNAAGSRIYCHNPDILIAISKSYMFY